MVEPVRKLQDMTVLSTSTTKPLLHIHTPRRRTTEAIKRTTVSPQMYTNRREVGLDICPSTQVIYCF